MMYAPFHAAPVALGHSCEVNFDIRTNWSIVSVHVYAYILTWRFGFRPMSISINDSFDVWRVCVLCFPFCGRSIHEICKGVVLKRPIEHILELVIIPWKHRVSSGLSYSIDFAPRVHSHTHMHAFGRTAHTFPFTFIYNSWCLLIFCLIIPTKSLFMCSIALSS